jgi:hypothetical protein
VSLNVYHSVNLAKISRIIKMWDFIQLMYSQTFVAGIRNGVLNSLL